MAESRHKAASSGVVASKAVSPPTLGGGLKRLTHLFDWVSAIPLAAQNVELNCALMNSVGVDILLTGLGFSPFTKVLSLRFMKLVGLGAGPTCIKFGHGAYSWGNKLLGVDDDENAPEMARMHDVWLLLEPHFAYLVLSILNESFLFLVDFQLFQGMCCEARKADNCKYGRRPNHEERVKLYMALSRLFRARKIMAE